jgi:hypothetical protein
LFAFAGLEGKRENAENQTVWRPGKRKDQVSKTLVNGEVTRKLRANSQGKEEGLSDDRCFRSISRVPPGWIE